MIRLLAFVLALCLTTSHAMSQTPDTRPHATPTLTVEGTCQLEKPADELRLSLGVISNAATAGDALEHNSDAMQSVMDALKRAGLTEDEYQTGRFRIQPQYSPRPRNAGGDWRPQIIGYQVQNSIMIQTPKLDKAGELIDVAVRAGANSVDSISFGIADPQTHRQEAIRTATANARLDARTLASAASLRLVRVLDINLDGAQARPYVPQQFRAEIADVGMARGGSTPIAPGDVTIRASVRIVYEIASRE